MARACGLSEHIAGTASPPHHDDPRAEASSGEAGLHSDAAIWGSNPQVAGVTNPSSTRLGTFSRGTFSRREPHS